MVARDVSSPARGAPMTTTQSAAGAAALVPTSRSAPKDPGGAARGRRSFYILLPLMLVAMAVPLQFVPWRSGPALHTTLEGIATLISLMVGVIALVRFYTRKNNLYLLVGVGQPTMLTPEKPAPPAVVVPKAITVEMGEQLGVAGVSAREAHR